MWKGCSCSANKETGSESNMLDPAQSIKDCETEKTYDSYMSQTSLHTDNDTYVNEAFTVLRTLGKGASCRVVECAKKDDGKKYAQKILQKSERRNEYLWDNEMKILTRLSHPNIVVYHGAYEGANNFYILTELCLGGELFDRIVNTKINTRAQAEKLVLTMLSAIQHCHHHQIVHRDIKPENFVFKTNELESELVLIDFGCATIVEDNTVYYDFVGTPYYIAPESAVSTYVRTGRTLKSSDIWSIGILAFTLMTGRPPFDGNSCAEILQNIVAKPLVLPKDIELSESAVDFINHMLVKNPEERMCLQAALDHPWVNGKTATNIPNSIKKTLRDFNQQCKLKKAISKALAQNMYQDAQEGMRKQFDKLDGNRDGKLSSNEIALFLMDRENGLHRAYKEAGMIIGTADEDDSKNIEFTEFTWMWQHHLLTTNDNYISDVFNVFDLNGDGKIDTNELGAMLEMTNGSDLKKLLQLIQEVDTNEDGFIDFPEFKAAMKKQGEVFNN